jgi:hypothetical protein
MSPTATCNRDSAADVPASADEHVPTHHVKEEWSDRNARTPGLVAKPAGVRAKWTKR